MDWPVRVLSSKGPSRPRLGKPHPAKKRGSGLKAKHGEHVTLTFPAVPQGGRTQHPHSDGLQEIADIGPKMPRLLLEDWHLKFGVSESTGGLWTTWS